MMEIMEGKEVKREKGKEVQPYTIKKWMIKGQTFDYSK